MGIKLMVEIFDHWQDAGLTAGERGDLLVLAENANDGTRLTFGPVHADYILRRAGKTAEGWKNSIGKLVRKKVLTVETPGRIGQVAVYRLEPLCPLVRHSGYKGLCERPPKDERVTAPVTLPEKEGHFSGDPLGNPTGDPLGQEGHPTGAERVTAPVTPTPPVSSFKTPSGTSSSPVAEEEEGPTVVGPSEGGGGSDLRSMAQQITAALDYRGKPPSRQQQNQITDRLVAALQAGWTVDQLAVHLDITGQDVRYPAAVYLARLDPARIATPPAPQVPSARRGGSRADALPPEAYTGLTVADVLGGSRRDTADGGMWERAMQRAQQKTAAMAGGGGHRPYSNDVWTQSADPAEAAKTPWCEHPDCDPVSRLRGLYPNQSMCDCHPKMQWP